jgi:hypothetical protein
VRSLLLLQVLLTLSKYYIPVFFVPTILLFIYKGMCDCVDAQHGAAASSTGARVAPLACGVRPDYKLPYPDSVIGWEIAFCCLYVFIDAGRISAGRCRCVVDALLQCMRATCTPSTTVACLRWPGTRGNKTETVGPMIWSILLALPVLALHAYYFAFQTYV